MVYGVDRDDRNAPRRISVCGIIIDVPFSDARFGGLDFSLEKVGALLVAFDASLFHVDWSGNLEYRFYTPLAREFFEKLRQKTENKGQN